MKYLIKISSNYYGYDNPMILLCDLKQNRPNAYQIIRKKDDKLRTVYEEITIEQLEVDAKGEAR